ncbi:GH36-type glycosyl hydrolase domain-containing protein [Oceanibium sediminis]|uniref:GH36-type glycosyl hydrolase domain-containing protein n=1 Tax=Oceanibium sediminis TaxID=2026339 RepID=UPI000DD430CA|nr:glucoamylase family protein [Oceanibium sediminis]
MDDAPGTSPDAPDRLASAALDHELDPHPPDLLDIYRALPALGDWFEDVRAWCADPPASSERSADWILDNDYQIRRALRRLVEGLPRPFYAQLPALAGPKGARRPRAFALAQVLYDLLQPQITLSALTRLVADYQRQAPLTNAELWALPLLLRLVALERLIQAVGQLDAALLPPVTLSTENPAPERPDVTEQIAGSITNLIAIDGIKWADFVDRSSCIEAALKHDPAGVYAAMTFNTRDRYRKAVERLAQRCAATEPDIAAKAVDLSRNEDPAGASAHVGYWLIGAGLPRLESALGARVPPLLALQRLLGRYRGWLYAAGLSTLVLAAIAVSVTYLWMLGATPLQWAAGIALTLLPATVPSVWVGHWLITRLSRPRVLPELDFSEAISPEHAAAIVLPVIIATEEEATRVTEKLEMLYLANRDPALRFVILSDPADATAEHMPGDTRIRAALRTRIEALNRRHAEGGDGPFLLLHRARRYNPCEGVWMAWERKRGKLEQFNRAVLDGESDAFDLMVGPVGDLGRIRYAITLDADTQMPPGSAARLVGIIAHPLNQPVIDPESGLVTQGHAIVQPRIEILPKLGKGTHFAHLYGGDTAVDIYSRAVSDVYQDLFGTGIYVGKGIYDISAMQRCMAGRIPENHILSHDLFEGLHGRAGLASNIVLYEDLPATYPEFAMRQHRWMRGDWQLAPWLGRRVLGGDNGRARTPLSPLDRWKMLDNLRRSLMPPALLLFFLGAWLALPGSAIVWTVLALAAPGSYLIGELFAIATGGIRRGALGNAVHKIRATGGRWFLSIVFLVSDTLIALDAILRTLWRMFVSGQKRLEWTSAAHAAAQAEGQGIRGASWRLMWPSSALALMLALYLVFFDLSRFWPAAPVLFLWLIAPEISTWSARPRYFRSETLDAAQRAFLKLVARRTWHFFEIFVGPDDNWLPPDNYQFGHREEVAHRTSPTNIGMFLVSALAARDLGFITTTDLLARCRNTLDTLGRLKSYRGHILNWYDTQTLTPLEPQYVSTVDSGNLAVSLVTLKQGCLELAAQPAIGRGCFGCLSTTLDLLLIALRQVPGHKDSPLTGTEQAIRAEIDRARASSLNWIDSLSALGGPLWQELETRAHDTIAALDDPADKEVGEITTWLDRYHHDLHAILRDIDTYMPWLHVIADAPPEASVVAGAIAEAIQTTDTPDVPAAIDAWKAAHPAPGPEEKRWLSQLQQAAHDGLTRQEELRDALEKLADTAGKMAYGMDFAFLFDPGVRLFSIGYNQSLGQMDPSHYDLLATEARLASYFAIAKHDAPIEHWFAFTRPITRLQGKPSILSWNGSMFEYLMPPLFLPSYRDTLLGESELTAVDFQREYARARGVPWGISESAFGTTDADGIFQYRAFGVPGLGIRRGLTEDLVVAPYGSALALCGWPDSAVRNLQKLDALGALTSYGFIEALDFTPDRAPPGRDFVPVTTYMAHHQGMLQTAVANALLDDIMVRRFLREKPVQAMELLLQERVPWDIPLERGRADESWELPPEPHPAPEIQPWVPSADFIVPQVHVLGNGSMSTLMTESGGGGISWKETALTRWWPDPTCPTHGMWMYLRDVQSGDLWSLGAAPMGRVDSDDGTSEVKCVFHQHMVELLRRHDGIVARMDVTIAPFDDVEIRRVTLVNEGDEDRTLDLTNYAEVVLAPPLDDERHPAFSKLFVHSTFLEDENALLFTRRPRRPETRPPVLLHKLVTDRPDAAIRSWETDRHAFLGRNRGADSPEGLHDGLSETAGWTLDPVIALQLRVRLKPMEPREIFFLTIAGPSRGEVVRVARRYPAGTIARTFRESQFEARRAVQRLGLDPAQLPALQLLSSLLVHVNRTFRTPPPEDSVEGGSQPDLWRFGISGDFPILVLKLSGRDESPLLDVLLRGHRLWRQAGLRADLVILRDAATSYEEPLREKVLSILGDTNATALLGMRGGVHLLAGDQMTPQLRRGVEAAAHVVLEDEDRPLRDMLDRVLQRANQSPPFVPGPAPEYAPVAAVERPHTLLFDNELGGFDPDTGDYLIHLPPGRRTPAPWCNILANESFGCLVSEAGFGTTWALNSGEHRLTPWSNDPVTDTPGEALYLRDEANADLWTTTPAPMGQSAACLVRHGAGVTEWRQNSHGLEQTLQVFVPVDEPVKLVRLRLANRSGQARRISATYYAEWLLGALGSVARPHTRADYDPGLETIIAQNAWNPEFAGRVAFLTATLSPHSVTGDRHDFLGRNGSVSAPEGLRRWDLGGRFADGGDACAAYQVHLDLSVDDTAEVVFALGEVEGIDALAPAVAPWKERDAAEHALSALRAHWARILGAVSVKTPDPAFDLMLNRWLPYQNRACRIMARAGFYQAGGAYGFRDQLQDVLALLPGDPGRARQHILEAAHHQFEAGDVLHWWHPPAGRGVRTRCSDDYLWLAYVTARYVEATGNTGVLDTPIPFLSAPELRPEEHDRYALFDTGATGSLYDHCARALDLMMVTGAHGLPLIGTGDWNDGMDRVGDAGSGESVWLAWFQIATVGLFAPLARDAGRPDDAERWETHARKLEQALSDQAWDGEWYLRAFDDDGQPWGASRNEECRIDLIAQAWSVLSGLPADARARAALNAAEAELVDPKARLIRLLTPPFDKTDRDPGYIHAYPPGIRENGGQYTHAAAWLGAAHAALGDGERAWRVFDLINPIRRSASLPDATHYRREPYVLPGDVSGVGEQTGRGGWSWYTGSAGWAFQLGLSGILGISPRPGAVHIAPCLPRKWGGARVRLSGANGCLDITIEDPERVGHGTVRISRDGKPMTGEQVPYPGPGRTSAVLVRLEP